MLLKQNSILSAVSMDQYGIEAVVLTEHEKLKDIEKIFLDEDDSKWMGGKGKRFLHGWLKVNLLKEDKYFTKHSDEVDVNNQRWNDFCEDCINFAVLTMVLYKTPIHLIHPSQYETTIQNSTPKGTRGEKPSLISGIECVIVR